MVICPQRPETGPSRVRRGTDVGLAPPDSLGLSMTWMASSVMLMQRYLIQYIVSPVAQLTRKKPKLGAVWQRNACRTSLPGGNSGRERSARSLTDATSVGLPSRQPVTRRPLFGGTDRPIWCIRAMADASTYSA